MKTFNELQEGVYDPNILKAFFLAGGPGSGKSYVVKRTTGGLGMKILNSDDHFERLLKQAGLDSKMPPEEKQPRDVARDRAKEMTKKQRENYLFGRLGLIIDGTGKNYDKVTTASNSLRAIGYETYMKFVNTSLDVDYQRNEMRKRKVPEEIVKSNWEGVQTNIGKYQKYFGPKNFIIVDNNVAYETGSNSEKLFFGKIFAQISKLIKTPTDNPTASKWIANELRMKQLMFED